MQRFFENILNQISNFLPGILGTLLILIIGWIIAKGVSRLVGNLVGRLNITEQLEKKGMKNIDLEKIIRKFVYYILMVIVLMLVLERLGVNDVLDPLKNMVNSFVGFLPNLIAAGIIAFAGYIIASVVSEMVGLAGNVFENFSDRMNVKTLNLAKIVKQLVFIFIFVPILISALDALGIDAISSPAKDMLSTFINSIPSIIAAALIMGLFYIGGTYVVAILKNLFKNLGMDSLSQKLGLDKIIGEKQSLSDLTGNVIFFFIMFSATITAVEKLGFFQLTDTLNSLLDLSGQIFLGIIIMSIGMLLANMVSKTMGQSQGNQFIASVVRVAMLGLFLAIALRTMGIANDIVNLAFGLTLGSVAVAVALSFGLGGREAAGKQMEKIFQKFNKKEEEK